MPVTTIVAMKISDESMTVFPGDQYSRLGMEFTEPRWKFLIDAVESAIGENRDDIA